MESEKVVFNIEKDAKVLRVLGLFILAILSSVLFECFRGGLYTYLYNVTPKLFGVVATQQISSNMSFFLALAGLVFFVLFFYSFVRLFIIGTIVKLEVKNDRIYQYRNGIIKKVNIYSLSTIKRITTKQSSAFVSSIGMRVYSYTLVFYSKDNTKKYKVLCRYSQKKLINSAARELRKILKQIN